MHVCIGFYSAAKDERGRDEEMEWEIPEAQEKKSLYNRAFITYTVYIVVARKKGTHS